MAKLGDICTINMGQSPSSSTYNSTGEGLPFFQGNADFGDIHPTVRTWCSNPIKIAEKGDLLISVRAPIGALNIANEQCCIGRGLAALTNCTKNIYKEYLWFALLSKIDELNSKGTGSTFKSINKKILAETSIPLPSLERQKQIAKQLICLATLLSRKKQQLSKLDQLVKSRFIEMFGDPVENPYKWNMTYLNMLGELNRGISKHRPRNAPELLNGKYPLIQTGDIASSDLYITKYLSTYSELGLKQSRMWPSGTLCITIAANIAKTSILKFDACFPDSVVGFISGKEYMQVFIYFWFSFFQKILEEQAPESAQKNINLKILNELKVISPPSSLQKDFFKFVQQVEKTKSSVKQSLEKLETLKKTLMQEYFE